MALRTRSEAVRRAQLKQDSGVRRKKLNSRMRLHTARVIAALGKSLPKGAVTHHHSDTQLVICESQSYHMMLERRTRVLRAGGNPNTDAWCSGCQAPRPLSRFETYKRDHGYHRKGSTYLSCKDCNGRKWEAHKARQAGNSNA